MPNKERIREVNELKICCTNHREGCGWVGELGGLKSHLDSDKGCGYVEVTCTNKGCGERVSRMDLQTHLQGECYYRPYECEHCGHKDTYTAITGEQEMKTLRLSQSSLLSVPDRESHSSECPEYPLACPNSHYSECPEYLLACPNSHYSECPEYPLACPNRCGVTGIRRRAMPDHHSSCPLEPLDCPFKDAGCTEKIAREDMEDHMTANQQKHTLLTFQSLQRSNQQMKQELHQSSQQMEKDRRELRSLKDDIRREIDSLEESIRRNTSTPESTAQSLRCMKSILQMSLDEIGDTLTFRVRGFLQLRKEKKAWHSPPFSIGTKVRVRLAVYPSGVWRGQGSHVSVSLILMEVVQKEEDMCLEYNVSVAAIGQHRSATHKTLKLCTFRKGDKARYPSIGIECGRYVPRCSARFPFPSPGAMLRSDKLFLEIEEANSPLTNDAMTLELKLLEHNCH